MSVIKDLKQEENEKRWTLDVFTSFILIGFDKIELQQSDYNVVTLILNGDFALRIGQRQVYGAKQFFVCHGCILFFVLLECS